MNYKKLLNVFRKKSISFVAVFLGYIIFSGFVNKTYVIFHRLYSSFDFWYSTFFIFINFLFVPLLVSLALNLSFDKIMDLKYVAKGRGMFSFLGIFGTLLGGSCPSCFVGLFPAFVGLFGASFTLSNLPFYGLEIQVVSSIVLIISLHYLTRDTVCMIR